jgi:hypothetical protein
MPNIYRYETYEEAMNRELVYHSCSKDWHVTLSSNPYGGYTAMLYTTLNCDNLYPVLADFDILLESFLKRIENFNLVKDLKDELAGANAKIAALELFKDFMKAIQKG